MNTSPISGLRKSLFALAPRQSSWHWSAPAGPAAPPPLVADRLEKNIRLACFALQVKGARYVFILQPNLAVTLKELSDREKQWRDTGAKQWPKERLEYFRKCYGELRRRLPAVRAQGFAFGDGSTVFDRATGKDEIFLDAFHFGDRGNEIIASSILGRIRPILTQSVSPAPAK
jgi:hypothetical protein